MAERAGLIARMLGSARRPTRGLETIGHLDRLLDGKAWGWAFHPSAPARRVALRLVVDGACVAEGMADGYRGDLHEKGFGDGCCAFVFVLPADKLDGREHGVEVVDARTGRPLLAQTRTYRLDARGVKRRRVVDLLFDPILYEKAAGPVVEALDHYRRTGWRRRLWRGAGRLPAAGALPVLWLA